MVRHDPPPAPQEEQAGGREGGRPGRFFPLFSLRWSRSDPQYLEKVFEDVQEGGREGEFSAEKLNLPYSSGRVWDLSLLTAPQGTDMIFRTTLQLPKIPSSLPGCLPGCTARLLQKGEIGRAPSSRTPRAGREAAPPHPPPAIGSTPPGRGAMARPAGAKVVHVSEGAVRSPRMTSVNNFRDCYGFG